MFRQCSVCGQLIPAGEYERHRQAHKNTEPMRQRTRTAGWQRLRAAVRKRDGDRCVRCRRTRAQLAELGLRLHVHHLNGPEDNRMQALETRCEDCHPRGGQQAY